MIQPHDQPQERRMPDPSAVQAAILAIAQIREAWTYLDDDALTPGRTRVRRRPLTPAAKAELDVLLRAEKRDRTGNQRRGLYPLNNSPSPVVLDVVDAERHARIALSDLAWLAASEVRGRGRMLAWPPAGPITIDTIGDYLTVTVALVSDALARQAAKELAGAARQLEHALGLAERWTPVPARCPVCRRMSLRAFVSGPDTRAHTIVCVGADPACICLGFPHCPCERPGRKPVTRHIWSAAQLRHLGRIAEPA